MQNEKELSERISNLQSLAIDLLHSKALVHEKYCEPFTQNIYLSTKGLKGLEDIPEIEVKHKETKEFESQPFIIFRGFEFLVRI